LPSTTINVADKLASEIARLNPTRSVYLINTATAVTVNRIDRWLPGWTVIDNYAQITNNVPPALAAIGATKIDLLLWWQGEAEVADFYRYPGLWEQFYGRLLLESWFTRATPVMVFGLAPTTISGSIYTDIMNGHLQAVVRNDPDFRRFVYTGSLAASFWQGGFHLNGSGYDQAGKMAAAEFVYGPTRNALIDPVRSVLRPEVLAVRRCATLSLAGTLRRTRGSVGPRSRRYRTPPSSQTDGVGRRLEPASSILRRRRTHQPWRRPRSLPSIASTSR
jgi:hypothetical protein